MIVLCVGVPGGSDREESACSAGDPSSVPVGKLPRRRAWQPTLEFLLEKPVGRGACWAAVPGVAESGRTGRARAVLSALVVLVRYRIFVPNLSGDV